VSQHPMVTTQWPIPKDSHWCQQCVEQPQVWQL
jgi:hypothetical protein